MYHTTGLPAEAIAVCYQTLVHNHPRTPQATGRPPALSQEEEIRATPAYLRRNRAQSELAESFGVNQSSICRAIARWTPRIVEALADLVPTADDLDQTQTLIVDGTLVPCWDWNHQPGLYSGKHHTTGLNLQIACTLTGRLVWVLRPCPRVDP
ncbi:transposase family protein [Propionibacterium australiense]|uniref:transposase family protein n=1 Tax=Propionibacterium australiense TaxID=119981 RepID=UPI0014773A13|nr:transposase family protein [Propionibacterium australiense]